MRLLTSLDYSYRAVSSLLDFTSGIFDDIDWLSESMSSDLSSSDRVDSLAAGTSPSLSKRIDAFPVVFSDVLCGWCLDLFQEICCYTVEFFSWEHSFDLIVRHKLSGVGDSENVTLHMDHEA